MIPEDVGCYKSEATATKENSLFSLPAICIPITLVQCQITSFEVMESSVSRTNSTNSLFFLLMHITINLHQAPF